MRTNPLPQENSNPVNMSDGRSKLRKKQAQVSPDVHTSSLSIAETSRIQTPVQVSPDAHPTLLPTPETSISNNTHAGSTRMDGVGNLLYHLPSVHFNCFCLTRVMKRYVLYVHVVGHYAHFMSFFLTFEGDDKFTVL